MRLKKARLARITVILMLIAITLLFFQMIRGFFMTIILTAIFSGIMYPVYNRLRKMMKGRTVVPSLITIILFVLIILIPLATFMTIVVEQAITAGNELVPLLRERLRNPDSLFDELRALPVVGEYLQDEEQLLQTIEQAINQVSNFVVSSGSAITSGVVQFSFQTFIFLFTMYYFLIYGKQYLTRFLYYIPLETNQERILLNKFVVVTRATLKGTFVIGIIQGALGGVAMSIAGISNTLFWGVIMAVMSIIPAVGPAIVWFPAAVFLILGGHYVAGIGLLLFGAVVIGNIDNLLRPRLVGKDTQLPDLMILFGTLGGLAMFGMPGLIIGPIIAALFITIWEIYGETYRDALHPVHLFDEDE
mgnify:FL=1